MALLSDPGIKPYNEQELTANRIQFGNTQNQTQLLALADAKHQQEEAAAARAFLQQHPEFVLGGGGGPPQSLLGSLQTAPGGQPGGPMTQQAFGPGGVGPTQTVPAYPDASRFAGVSPQGGGPIPPDMMRQLTPTVTPPQSTLGSLGPQPQAPPTPQQRLLELARTNPEAALKVQALMQGQQDAALKREETRLATGTKVLEYVGRLAQGVSDQAGLVAMKQDLQRTGLHQYAAQLPEVYTKEAMAPFIAKALDVKESLTLQVQDLQAQAAVIKARKEGRSTDVDNQLRAMGVQPGAETPAQMGAALKAVEDAKVRVSASQGTGQIVPTQVGLTRINPRTGDVEVIKGPQGQTLYPPASGEAQKASTFGDLAQKAHNEAVELENKGLKPSLWDKGAQSLPLGMGNYLVSEDRRKYTNAINRFGEAWLRKTSGAVLSPTEYKQTDETYFPQPNDTQGQIEAKRAAREAVIKGMQEEGKQTGRPGSQPPPTTPALRPPGEMSLEDLRAERAAIKARGGQ